ncbi:hypothetical protein EON65_58240 [archaeon]|nr:MAG: hypothetical protein EON65_58240 [archaeon]
MLAIRASADANSAEQKRIAERKRGIVVLVNQFLVEQGYIEAAERLQSEASSILSKFDTADNMDLPLIIAEYEAYYEMRFDKKPKILKKLDESEANAQVNRIKQLSSKKSASSSKKGDSSNSEGNMKLPSISGSTSGVTGGGGVPNPPPSVPESGDFSISGTNITKKSSAASENSNTSERFEDTKLLKPLPVFADNEMRALATSIQRDIYIESPNIKFDDIIELDEAKRLLVEAVQLPLKYPSLFTGILRPWRGIVYVVCVCMLTLCVCVFVHVSMCIYVYVYEVYTFL